MRRFSASLGNKVRTLPPAVVAYQKCTLWRLLLVKEAIGEAIRRNSTRSMDWRKRSETVLPACLRWIWLASSKTNSKTQLDETCAHVYIHPAVVVRVVERRPLEQEKCLSFFVLPYKQSPTSRPTLIKQHFVTAQVLRKYRQMMCSTCSWVNYSPAPSMSFAPAAVLWTATASTLQASRYQRRTQKV